jgi:amino acid efflux transporter
MNNKLSLLQAIPLGIGSIIGSGILFLPSLTYKISESDVLVSWIVIISFCLIGTVYLKRLLFQSSITERNISGMVKVGLGETVGNSVYVILLGTVILGMPSAAIIAGDYLEQTLKIDYLKEVTAFLVITFAILTNLKGVVTSSKIAGLVAALLFAISIVFIFITTGKGDMNSVKPNFDIFKTYQGAVLAFWAFAGFENLTFLYDKFKKPKRDFLPTILISIAGCGVLYLFLVINYASIVEYSNIKTTVGLLQITDVLKLGTLKIIITLFALFAVIINLVSWTSGVAELVKKISEKELIPKFPKNLNTQKSVLLLGGLFYISLFFGTFFFEYFEKMLSVVSTNFLVVYALTFLSYTIFEKNKISKIIPILAFVCLLTILSSSGAYLLYPLVLFLLTYFNSVGK